VPIGVNLRNLECDRTSNFVTIANDDNSVHTGTQARLKLEIMLEECGIGTQLYESKRKGAIGQSRPA
jgi:hypothetical protein